MEEEEELDPEELCRRKMECYRALCKGLGKGGTKFDTRGPENTQSETMGQYHRLDQRPSDRQAIQDLG